MQIEEFPIQEFCDQAAFLCKKLADVELDGTAQSLDLLEQVIQQTRGVRRKNKSLMDDQAAWNMAVYYGTYFGQVMLQDGLAARGMKWCMNENGIPVIADGSHVNAISPITKIYRKLTDLENEKDEEGDLRSIYQIFCFLLDKGGTYE